MSINIFHEYEFEIAKSGGFVPVAISTCAGRILAGPVMLVWSEHLHSHDCRWALHCMPTVVVSARQDVVLPCWNTCLSFCSFYELRFHSTISLRERVDDAAQGGIR